MSPYTLYTAGVFTGGFWQKRFISAVFFLREMAPGKIRHTAAQNALLVLLYALLIVMVVFFVLSLRNRGQEAFDKCVQKTCELKGEEHCRKFRELNNCCLGAGGAMAQADGTVRCIFPE